MTHTLHYPSLAKGRALEKQLLADEHTINTDHNIEHQL